MDIDDLLENEKKIIDYLRRRDELKDYVWIMKQFGADVPDKEFFEKRFKRFYVIRFPSKAVVRELFEFLYNKESDLRTILEGLYRIDKNVQFSFATKIKHTVEPDKPIWDSQIRRAFGLKTPNGINDACEKYNELERKFQELLNDDRIKGMLDRTRASLIIDKNDINDVKLLDFILWSYRR
ncbi:MAG: hypothetical protein V1887_02825 [Candidatus Aenigmatarchaeota archaeon]